MKKHWYKVEVPGVSRGLALHPRSSGLLGHALRRIRGGRGTRGTDSKPSSCSRDKLTEYTTERSLAGGYQRVRGEQMEGDWAESGETGKGTIPSRRAGPVHPTVLARF